MRKECELSSKFCPLEYAVNSIASKWKIPILWHMQQGIKRPSQFLRCISGLDRRVLNLQLKELEASKIIQKNVFAELPPRVEYNLTHSGNELIRILWLLNDWGEDLYHLNEAPKNEEIANISK